MRAAGCKRWCEANNAILKTLEGDNRNGFHMTCCQWDQENGKCDFRLGSTIEWSGTTTSILYAPGAKLIATEGTGYPSYNGKAALPKSEQAPKVDKTDTAEPAGK